MSVTALVLIAAPIVVAGYAYAGYPLLLLLLGGRRTPPTEPRSDPLPTISITVAVYNEEASIGQTLEQLLATDYPRERRQIIVISDASTDGTDEVVGSFSDRGVELIRLPQRGGKTAAENASSSCIRGDVVVNVDATIRIDDYERLVAGLESDRREPVDGKLRRHVLDRMIDEAKRRADFIAVTIFVNPLQFAEDEDLGRYPRTMQDDLEGAREEIAS